MLDVTPALPTFFITLREGVEAALVVGIVLACLKKAGQAHLNPWVYGGIGSGIVASGGVGLLFVMAFQAISATNQPYGPVLKPLMQAGFSAIAIVLLSWMLIWMTQQARSLKAQIEGEVSTALAQTGAGWGIWGLIFFAVLREGFETVVFLAANLQQGWLPAVGAIVGLLAAVGIGILLFKLGVQINLRQFFQVMGVVLLLIVGGLVVSALAHLDSALLRLAVINPDANVCLGTPNTCILGPQIWDTRAILPERQFPGIILHTLLGYEDELFAVEAIGYIGFWLAIGGTYIRSLGSTLAAKPPATQS